MIEQRVQVVGTEAGFALLAAVPSSGCGTCGVPGGCGVSKLGRLLPNRVRVLRVPNELGARPGDQVTLGVGEDVLLASALAAYLPPLAGLVAGAGIGGALNPGDLWSMLGAGFGLLLGFAGSRLLGWLWQERHAPRMVARSLGTHPTPVVCRRAESDPSAS
jgi:sigma-E factor negative regulatory protein RseC